MRKYIQQILLHTAAASLLCAATGSSNKWDSNTKTTISLQCGESYVKWTGDQYEPRLPLSDNQHLLSNRGYVFGACKQASLIVHAKKGITYGGFIRINDVETTAPCLAGVRVNLLRKDAETLPGTGATDTYIADIFEDSNLISAGLDVGGKLRTNEGHLYIGYPIISQHVQSDWSVIIAPVLVVGIRSINMHMNGIYKQGSPASINSTTELEIDPDDVGDIFKGGPKLEAAKGFAYVDGDVNSLLTHTTLLLGAGINGLIQQDKICIESNVHFSINLNRKMHLTKVNNIRLILSEKSILYANSPDVKLDGTTAAAADASRLKEYPSSATTPEKMSGANRVLIERKINTEDVFTLKISPAIHAAIRFTYNLTNTITIGCIGSFDYVWINISGAEKQLSAFEKSTGIDTPNLMTSSLGIEIGQQF